MTLRERRERLGLSQRDLADVTGVARQTIARIERGDPVRASTVGQVEAALATREADATGRFELAVVVSESGAVNVTASGPVEDRREIVAAVTEIVQGIRA